MAKQQQFIKWIDSLGSTRRQNVIKASGVVKRTERQIYRYIKGQAEVPDIIMVAINLMKKK